MEEESDPPPTKNFISPYKCKLILRCLISTFRQMKQKVCVCICVHVRIHLLVKRNERGKWEKREIRCSFNTVSLPQHSYNNTVGSASCVVLKFIISQFVRDKKKKKFVVVGWQPAFILPAVVPPTHPFPDSSLPPSLSALPKPEWGFRPLHGCSLELKIHGEPAQSRFSFHSSTALQDFADQPLHRREGC